MIDIQAAWLEEWALVLAENKRRSPSYEVGEYSVTGKAPAPYGKRTLEYWADKGPKLAENWLAWRRRTKWDVWETPDGTHAIELAMNFSLPNDIPVVAYIDRVFVLPTGEVAVVDIKTGARMPETAEQLGLYATGIEILWGKMHRPTWGFFWDAHKGEHSKPYLLDMYTPQYFATLYGETAAGINAGYFAPKPANGCSGWCGLARYCHAVGGADAPGVDPLASA